MARLQDIPQLPRAHFSVDVPWSDLERQLARWDETWTDTETGTRCGGIDLDPDYQRAHVWTRAQQVAYVEYTLMGGEVGQSITWNNPTWDRGFREPTVLVDGKQRLEAVRAFLRDDFPVFGHVLSDFEDGLRGFHPALKFQVCCLRGREAILQLYLNINAGGTPHTEDELDRVRALLEKERKRS